MIWIENKVWIESGNILQVVVDGGGLVVVVTAMVFLLVSIYAYLKRLVRSHLTITIAADQLRWIDVALE